MLKHFSLIFSPRKNYFERDGIEKHEKLCNQVIFIKNNNNNNNVKKGFKFILINSL